MKMPVIPFAKMVKHRKLLLLLGLMALSGLYAAYNFLAGRGSNKEVAATHSNAFNMKLPEPLFDGKEEKMTKLDYYKRADEDSARKRAAMQQDPYFGSASSTQSLAGKSTGRANPTGLIVDSGPLQGAGASQDGRADELLKQLDQLKQAIQKPASNAVDPLREPAWKRTAGPGSLGMGKTVLEDGGSGGVQPARMVRPVEATPVDPQLDRLNTMLDKVIRLQQGRSAGEEAPGLSGEQGEATGGLRKETGIGIKLVSEPVAAETEVETVPAVVEEDQTLVSGATMVLRIEAAVMISGVRIPRNQLVYGLVSISNDRMLVDIHSIRKERNIYTTALQVYDLDGLPGIHIPGMLSREVAKQSADQGIGSINLAPLEPGIGAQAASAGIQTVKSLFSRKIRLVRASVPAGYRVLLRNSRGAGQHAVRVWVDSMAGGQPDSVRGMVPVLKRAPVKDSLMGAAKDTAGTTALIQKTVPDTTRAAATDTTRKVGEESRQLLLHDTVSDGVREDFVPFLHRSVREGGVSLILRGVYLREGLLWLSFLLENDSRIDYTPDYIRSFIRDRKKMKRMAVQEIPLPVVYERTPSRVAADSGQVINLAFTPFALGTHKGLVLQLAEKDGGRELNLEIKSKTLLNIQ